MEDFRKLELEITKDKLALLEIADFYRDLLADNRQGEAFGLLEKSQYQKLVKDFKQKIADWKNTVDTTPITIENIEFIKRSKQFLRQFEANDKETNQLFFSKIDLLMEEKNTALKNKEFKKANTIREEIIGIQQKIVN